jgi:hypothetical protein
MMALTLGDWIVVVAKLDHVARSSRDLQDLPRTSTSGVRRKTTNSLEDRTQLRHRASRRCWFFEPVELHGLGRRRERCPRGINKLFGTTICISDTIYNEAKAPT